MYRIISTVTRPDNSKVEHGLKYDLQNGRSKYDMLLSYLLSLYY